MTTTMASAYVRNIRRAVDDGEFVLASTLVCELGGLAAEDKLWITDEEEQFCDFVHGYSIRRKPFLQSELDPDVWVQMSLIWEYVHGGTDDSFRDQISDEQLNLYKSAFFNQGKYPYGRIANGPKRQVLYWYFQNKPWSTSIEISLVNENTDEVLWSIDLSHREMVNVMLPNQELNPDVNPYEFWSDRTPEQVNMVLDAYKSYLQWRRVHKV